MTPPDTLTWLHLSDFHFQDQKHFDRRLVAMLLRGFREAIGFENGPLGAKVVGVAWGKIQPGKDATFEAKSFFSLVALTTISAWFALHTQFSTFKAILVLHCFI